MESHAHKCVERNCEVAHKTVDQLPEVHSLFSRSPNKTRRFGNCGRNVRDLLADCIETFVVGKNWKTRCTLDSKLLSKTTHYVEPSVRFTHPTTDSICHVGKQATVCKLGVLQDADIAGTVTDSKIKLMSCAHWEIAFPCARFHGPCKKNTAVSHSCTDTEIRSLDARLRKEGIPAVTLLDTIIEILHRQAGGDSKPIHQTQIPTHHDPFGNIDHVPPKRAIFHHAKGIIPLRR